MSQSLIEKLQQSKAEAISRGAIITFRKVEITKQKLVGQNFQITYSWYQTPAKIGIIIPHTVENKDDLKVNYQQSRVIIGFPIRAGGQYHLDLALYSKIIPARSKTIHRLNQIQIVLQKQKSNQSWSYLRKDCLGVSQAIETQKISYPTSSKKPKDWDKIDRQIQGQILKNRQQFGEDPSMAFFKEIFSNADPEKRRAMMKSFQTSGGTVLSTDWNDVKTKDYEGKDRPSPPKGQQWKKRQI